MGTVLCNALLGFIMYIHYERGRESFNADPAAMLQLLHSDLISSCLQVYGWEHMSNVLARTPQWPVLTHSISPFEEVYYVS